MKVATILVPLTEMLSTSVKATILVPLTEVLSIYRNASLLSGGEKMDFTVFLPF